MPYNYNSPVNKTCKNLIHLDLQRVNENNLSPDVLNNIEFYDTACAIKFPEGSMQPGGEYTGIAGGINETVVIDEIPNTARRVHLSFYVYFDMSFRPPKDGKMYGISMGENFSGGHSGNNQLGSSYKFIFNGDINDSGKIGIAAYNYHFNRSGQYGEGQGIFIVNKNEWVKLDMFLETNTFTNGLPNDDGKVHMYCTDSVEIQEVFARTDLLISRDENMFIDKFNQNVFCGGIGEHYAVPITGFIIMRDVRLSWE